jgi:hypothetical protein
VSAVINCKFMSGLQKNVSQKTFGFAITSRSDWQRTMTFFVAYDTIKLLAFCFLHACVYLNSYNSYAWVRASHTHTHTKTSSGMSVSLVRFVLSGGHSSTSFCFESWGSSSKCEFLYLQARDVTINQVCLSRIWGSHGDEYEDSCLLGCSAV